MLARLEQEGLPPTAEAAPERWLRRVTFDLTGLPPTAEEVREFFSATSAHGATAYENAVDRLHTFGTAILGLTLECARCHDHKYDPISQRDYYSLSAFFNSIDENGLYDRTEKVPSPTCMVR